MHKIQWRLLPFLFLCYIVANLDRINVGFASLTMNKALGIRAEQYGLLAGMFFLSYFLFEVPSNLIMSKVGARVWIARILISWGIVAACTGFAHSINQLYIARFLLGVAEAGFFPGIIYYFTLWLRHRERAQAVALLMVGLPICSVIGGPVSGLILDHVHLLALSSWRWLFILEGAPAIVLGVVTYFLLPDRPADAKFLSQPEKDWLNAELKREADAALAETGHVSALKAMGIGRVWHLTFIYFFYLIALNWMNFYLPQVIKALSKSYTNTTVGFLVVIPQLCAAISMILIARHSDRTQERRFHLVFTLGFAAIALLATTLVSNPVISIALLTIMAMGLVSSFGPFWSLPPLFLTGIAAASGIAFINSFAQLAGFLGLPIVGYIQSRTGSAVGGAIFAGSSLVVSLILVLVLPTKAGKKSSATER